MIDLPAENLKTWRPNFSSKLKANREVFAERVKKEDSQRHALGKSLFSPNQPSIRVCHLNLENIA